MTTVPPGELPIKHPITPSLAAVGLPQGIGRFGWRWLLTVAVLLAIAGFGLYAYWVQMSRGFISTGLRTMGEGGAPWGPYIAFDVIFIGFAFGGIMVTTLAHLFHLRRLYPVTRMADMVALCSVLCAGMCIMADVGRPLQAMTNLPLYAKTASPFFGSFTLLVGADLLSSVVYEFLEGRADSAVLAKRSKRFGWAYRLWAMGWKNTSQERRRRRQVDFWLSLVMLILLLVAYSTLGFIFGIQGGRPGWFTAMAAPRFVIMAAVSGVAMVILVAGAARRFMGLAEVLTLRTFTWLSNALWIGIAVFLYLMFVEELTNRYAADRAQTLVAQATSTGPFAAIYWTVIALLSLPALALFVQYLRRRTSIGLSVIAAACVVVGAVLKRFLVVVPSQTHGQFLDYPIGSYSPTWVELGVLAGITSIGVLAFLVGIKLYPLIPLAEARVLDAAPTVQQTRSRRALRKVLFLLTLFLGLAICVVAFMISARWGTEPHLDPILPGAPVLFIIGMAVCLGSGIVYELFPWSLPPKDESEPSGESPRSPGSSGP